MVRQAILHRGCLTKYGEKAETGAVLLCVFVLCIILSSPGCTGKEDQVKDERVNSVKALVVKRMPVRPYIDAIGSLSPNEEVIISSEVDGILNYMWVDEGTAVSKGTVLARINDTDYHLGVAKATAELRQAEANLANLKIEFGRKKTLLKEKLVTMQQFDDVSTRMTVAVQEVDRAKAALSLASERLYKATIRSPIKGIIKEKKVTAGDFVNAGRPVLSIVQINPLKLTFTIAEKDVSSLEHGQDVIFTVDPFPGREFGGKLSIIYPSLDEQTRTLRVEAIVPNRSLELKPGFFAKVKIYTGFPKNAVVIPNTSILYEGAKIRVFVQEGNKARERALKVGGKYGEMVEVLEGLTGGEKIIVVGQNNLTDGVRINVVR